MNRLGLFFVLSLFGVCTYGDDAVDAASDQILSELQKRVEENERHYQNIEVAVTTDYRTARPSAELGTSEIVHSITTQSLLCNGDRFRWAYQYHYKSNDKWRTSFSREIFDGSTRRTYNLRDVKIATAGSLAPQNVNVSTETPARSNLCRPHMFFLGSGYANVPLSVMMKGHDAVRAYDGHGHMSEGATLEMSYLGKGRVQDLQCEGIKIDLVLANGHRHNGWELWLAKQRNYIPARYVGYTYRWSTDMPVSRALVYNWREVQPGIWFPIKVHQDRYNSMAVKAGQQTMQWKKDIKVSHVLLEPPADDDFFTDFLVVPTAEREHLAAAESREEE